MTKPRRTEQSSHAYPSTEVRWLDVEELVAGVVEPGVRMRRSQVNKNHVGQKLSSAMDDNERRMNTVNDTFLAENGSKLVRELLLFAAFAFSLLLSEFKMKLKA